MASTRTQIYLTADQRERLDTLSARTGQGLATLIREAVDAYLRKEPDLESAISETFGALPNLRVTRQDDSGLGEAADDSFRPRRSG